MATDPQGFLIDELGQRVSDPSAALLGAVPVPPSQPPAAAGATGGGGRSFLDVLNDPRLTDLLTSASIGFQTPGGFGAGIAGTNQQLLLAQNRRQKQEAEQEELKIKRGTAGLAREREDRLRKAGLSEAELRGARIAKLQQDTQDAEDLVQRQEGFRSAVAQTDGSPEAVLNTYASAFPRQYAEALAKRAPKDARTAIQKDLEAAGFALGTPAFKALMRRDIEGRRKQVAQKTPNNFLLPNEQVVLSRDGATYEDPQTGQTRPLPSNSVRVGADVAADVKQAAGQRQRAAEELAQMAPAAPTGAAPTGAEAAADAFGTGPMSNVFAAIDATVGGVLKLDTVFPETQDNRQFLKLVKQTGKEALLNSSRGAIWEQERIDQLFPDPSTFFTNPATEARKVPLMRQVLTQEKQFNLELLARGGLDLKEANKLERANAEIDRTLKLLETGPVTGTAPVSGTTSGGINFTVN